MERSEAALILRAMELDRRDILWQPRHLLRRKGAGRETAGRETPENCVDCSLALKEATALELAQDALQCHKTRGGKA